MAMPGLVLWTFDGPPPEANESPLPSPPPSTRTSPRDIVVIDSDSDMEPEVFHDASPVIAGGSNSISGPTPWSSLQKVEPPSTPPTTPPGTGPLTATPEVDRRNVQPGLSRRPTEVDPISPRSPLHRGPSVNQPPAQVVARILRGEAHKATFDGTSQYAAGGASACGLASMNAIRIAFELCSKMTDAEQLVSALISEEFVRAAMGIATHWPNDMHLEVEPILQLPLFSNAIRVVDDQYAECTYRTFSNAVVALRFDEESPGPRAVCMTRPPEVISVMHIPIPRPTSGEWTPWTSRRAESIYLVFDSHPRPNHPNGAAVQIFPTRPTDDVAEYLMDLFQVDQDIINDPNLEWTVQLFGQVSYHLLAPSPNPQDLDIYALNMRILEADRKRNWAEDKLKSSEAETRKLRSQVFDKDQEIAMLNFNLRRARDDAHRFQAQMNRPLPPPPKKEENKGSSWFSSGNRAGESSKSKGKAREDAGGWQAGPASKVETNFPSWSASGNRAGASSRSPETGWGGSTSSRTSANSNPTTRTSGTADFEFSHWGRGPSRPPASYASKAGGSSNQHQPPVEDEDVRSIELALRLQREFDDERAEISRGESLAMSMERPKFDCGICMDTFTDEAIARIDGCGHACCRDCMRSNIQSKIEERRYPIPCPFCVAGSDDNNAQRRGVGTISPWIVETIGISSDLFNIYTELQMAEHSIMIDCRGLKLCVRRSQRLRPRRDYYLSHAKMHSDMVQAMQSDDSGWGKAFHCPGCRTPIERSMGCNHMTCTTPGCNMHFCYKCGAVVINGGTRNEIQAAVASHFRTCALFDVPREG